MVCEQTSFWNVRYLVLIIPERCGQVKNVQVGGGKPVVPEKLMTLPFSGLLRD